MFWLRFCKYVALYLVATVPAALLGWLPGGLLDRVRRFELRILYKVARYGPSGIDDGIQIRVMRAPERYWRSVFRMLEKPRPGSNDEEVGLYFVELVRGAPETDPLLSELATRHPNPKVRDFIQDVLRHPVAAPYNL